MVETMDCGPCAKKKRRPIGLVAVRKGRNHIEPMLGRYSHKGPSPSDAADRAAPCRVGDMSYLRRVLGYTMKQDADVYIAKHRVVSECTDWCQYGHCAARIDIILDAARTRLAEVKDITEADSMASIKASKKESMASIKALKKDSMASIKSLKKSFRDENTGSMSEGKRTVEQLKLEREISLLKMQKRQLSDTAEYLGSTCSSPRRQFIGSKRRT